MYLGIKKLVNIIQTFTGWEVVVSFSALLTEHASVVVFARALENTSSH